jgi:sec-independent protein translocase protein TatA
MPYLAFGEPGPTEVILFLGSIGPTEIILILAALLLIFGAKKLPELARSMGSSINEFKRGLKEEDGTDKLPPSDDDKRNDG